MGDAPLLQVCPRRLQAQVRVTASETALRDLRNRSLEALLVNACMLHFKSLRFKRSG
jgi:hypothetical protein